MAQAVGAELAAEAAIEQACLTDLETKRRGGLASTTERPAEALEVPAAWFA